MSDKSPRQGMTKKTGEVDQGEARRQARQGVTRRPSRTRSTRARRSEPVGLGVIGRRPRRTSTGCRSTRITCPARRRRPAARITLEHGYGARFGARRRGPGAVRGGFASREEIARRSDVVAAAQAAARGRRRDPRRADPVGLAALRPGHRAHPGRDRPSPDPDRLRGDEPLDARRHGRAARVPQEQRARRLLLGAPRAPAGGLHRGLRSPADRGRHRVRRDRARCSDRPQRARRARGRSADQPRVWPLWGHRSTRCGSDSSTTTPTAITRAT